MDVSGISQDASDCDQDARGHYPNTKVPHRSADEVYLGPGSKGKPMMFFLFETMAK